MKYSASQLIIMKDGYQNVCFCHANSSVEWEFNPRVAVTSLIASCNEGQPGRCPGNQPKKGQEDVAGTLGNTVLLDSGFHTGKNFSKNYLQFGDVHSKKCFPVLS
jgi:hypothetical protein